MSTAQLAVVMPLYNEEANIEAVVTEWVEALSALKISFEVLAVNDGSRDGTGAALQRLVERFPGAVLPVEKQNGGHGRACRAGYVLAVERGPEWTLQIDSDGQCDPSYFAAFWQARAQADAVFGVRISRDDGPMRMMISAICQAATSLLCGMNLKDVNVPYRLIRTAALKEALRRMPADFDMQNTALTLALRRDPSVRWHYVPIHFRDRQGGTNSINLRRIVAMGWELLTNLHRVGR